MVWRSMTLVHVGSAGEVIIGPGVDDTGAPLVGFAVAIVAPAVLTLFGCVGVGIAALDVFASPTKTMPAASTSVATMPISSRRCNGFNDSLTSMSSSRYKTYCSCPHPHCGESATGEYVQTLQVIDVATGWDERAAILGHGQAAMEAGFRRILAQLPYVVVPITRAALLARHGAAQHLPR